MIYILVFLSGLAGLIYEILWMKQMGLLFGSSSHAAAATLAAFFGGLAVGSWFWGRRSVKAENSLRVYAWLEVGIAVTALLYFVVLKCYYYIYPYVYQNVESENLLLVIKFALAVLLVFPPAFCMGGTIPVIGQYLIRRQSSFGATSALLYGINTLGAAIGALLAGFFLPLWVGFKATCGGAIFISLTIAAGSLILSKRPLEKVAWVGQDAKKSAKNKKTPVPADTDRRWPVLPVCFLSGFGVLALEVLWTRMFSQVLENSVYTFAAILVTVLICLSFGALISSCLARLKVSAYMVLLVLMVLSGFAVSITPFIFVELTDSMKVMSFRGSWASYISLIFKTCFLAFGPSALLLGTVFPFLMKTEQKHAVSAGVSLGRLAAVNTVGAILGSVLCGFVFLEMFGMWPTMQIIACVYLVAVLVLPLKLTPSAVAVKVAGVVCLLISFTVLSPSKLPLYGTDITRNGGKVLELWQGSDCTVAAVSDNSGVNIKINSSYSLGSTGAFMQEKLQNDIPLMIYPQTESVFFLGMGTGITAGNAFDEQFGNIKRTVTCELVPEVVTAAKKYLSNADAYDYAEKAYTGSRASAFAVNNWQESVKVVSKLFSDPNSTVLAEDGRHYLMASGETFDMVNADLFVPYRSGAGSLYTKEHFESVKESLEPGGVFFQWLPLYQVTEYEFSVIAKTMLDVFGRVSLWRNNFQPGDEVIVFVGHKDETPLPACSIDSTEDKQFAVAGKTHRDLQYLSLPFNSQTILFFYCGNLSMAKELFQKYPINTDDKPIIEYMAPRTYRQDGDSSIPWFIGPRLARLVEKVQELCPPENDPLLVNRTKANRRLPSAGLEFYRARLWEVMGMEQECIKSWEKFKIEWTDQK